jgi:TonB family protein
MNRPINPAGEIRGALDREVRRTFDPARLTALPEAASRVPGGRQRADRGRGPLGRVPAVAQWVGIAAAVIAALTGLRSLYLEFAKHDPGSVIVEARSPTRPEREEPVAPLEPSGSRTAADVAAEPMAAVPRARPEPRDEGELRGEPEKPSAHGAAADGAATEPTARPQAETETRSDAPPSTPRPAGGGSGTELPVAPPFVGEGVALAQVSEPTEPPEAPSMPDAGLVTFSAGETAYVSGVRVTSLSRYGEIEVGGTLREVPQLGATLVTFGDGTWPFTTSMRPRRAREPAQPDESGEFGNPGSFEGSWVAGVAVGTVSGTLSKSGHALLGERLQALSPAELPTWTTGEAQGFLQQAFRLGSVVMLDVAEVPVRSIDPETSFVAVGGDRLYRIAIRSTPTDRDGYGVAIRVSRVFARHLPRHGWDYEAALRVAEGRVAILAVPFRAADRMLFVAVTPRPDRSSPAAQNLPAKNDPPDAEPVLISRSEPSYPIEALEYAPRGEVRLRALVGETGDVESVTVVEVPQGDGAEYLAAAAAEAVRTWQYIPAQYHGRDIAWTLEITLHF